LDTMSLLQKNMDLFKCPVCSGSMELREGKSLACPNGHCLDVSRYGYVNFLLRSVKTEYNKTMLRARNRIMEKGFFLPLAQQISEIAAEEMDFYAANNADKQIRVLDAGCGEGTFLVQTANCFAERTAANITGIGMDISKDGIQIAAKKYKGFLWCVGDLANCPFMNKKIDVILNILSPSNYGEFRRLLGSSGFLVKAVPGRDYLKELRRVFYSQTDKQDYSNERVLNHFRESFDLIHTKQICYSVDMNQESLEDLIQMTPLSWGAPSEKVEEARNSGITSITVDMTVLFGR
jgi:23S rRNA (guanine745-N1)-methyltransferase